MPSWRGGFPGCWGWQWCKEPYTWRAFLLPLEAIQRSVTGVLSGRARPAGCCSCRRRMLAGGMLAQRLEKSPEQQAGVRPRREVPWQRSAGDFVQYKVHVSVCSGSSWWSASRKRLQPGGRTSASRAGARVCGRLPARGAALGPGPLGGAETKQGRRGCKAIHPLSQWHSPPQKRPIFPTI